MTSTSLLMVVLAAMAHATWNLLAKRASTVGAGIRICVWPVLHHHSVCPLVIWVLVNEGMDWNGPVIACLLVSSLLHFRYNLFSQRGYQVVDLSMVYPIARVTGPYCRQQVRLWY